jgi:hypothetical protein
MSSTSHRIDYGATSIQPSWRQSAAGVLLSLRGGFRKTRTIVYRVAWPSTRIDPHRFCC